MIDALHAPLHSWIAANATGMRDHLFFSTVVLALLLAVSAAPFIRPRTRYALILLGVAKFLVPATLLSAVARLLPAPSVAMPAVTLSEVFALPSRTPAQSEILCLVAAIWVAGTVLFALRVLAAHRHWMLVVRSARTASQRERDAMDSVAGRSPHRVPRIARSAAAVPLTVGVLRPVVLLPERCVDELDDAELRAVLAHEVAHVERRHNLGSLAQAAVLALFWFNPVLWVARRALDAEAEKDCDESVLNLFPDPPAYLSGMLKVSYAFIAPQPVGVSCMSALRLKGRMDHLMKQQESPTRSIPHRLALALGIAAVALSSVLVSAGEPSKSAPVPAGKDGVTLPKVVSQVQPVYPEAARQQKLQGIVLVVATIDETGNVTGASIAKGIEGAEGKALGDAAVAAVKQWKFEPALKEGKPVVVTFKVTVRFKLDCDSKKDK